GVCIDIPCKCVAKNNQKRLNGILQADFLALFVSAAVITDRHFVESCLALCELNRNLRLDTKAVAANRYRSRKSCTECFVARLHISQGQVGNDVTGAGQDLVCQRVPEVQDSPAPETLKP